MTAAEARNVKPGKPSGPPMTRLSLVQFLIVDDHAFVRGIVSQHLRSCGIERLSFAQNGKEAVRFLKLLSPSTQNASLVELMGGRPDIVDDLAAGSADFKTPHSHCVITDFGMPHTNGLQLMKAVRCGETSVPRDTPVILLTGYTDDYVVSTALRLDVNAFVLKPISRNTLWEKVDRVLKSASPVQSIDAYASVEIPDESGKIIGRVDTTKIVNPEIIDEDDMKAGTLWIPLKAVRPGAVLAGDIHNERGVLLLRQGTVFSEGTLHKLLDVQNMSGFGGKIPIVKTAEERKAGIKPNGADSS